MPAPLPLALMPVARQRFFDSDGAPLSNGYLQFFITNTSTPKEVFADADGNTSLGVEVDLDAEGYAPAIYLANDGGYSVSLLSEDDVEQWDQPQVENTAEVFLNQLGSYLQEGSRDVTGTYEVDPSDNFITCDTSGGDVTIQMPPASERTQQLVVKNMGAGVVNVTPDGAETIDEVAAPFVIPAAASPMFPSIVMYPNTSGYWIPSSHGIS